MNHFPTPYPDELLYSILARYNVRSGNTSPKTTLKELFGINTITAVVDMPSDIDALICRLPKAKKLDAEALIMNNTLFPYYTAFLHETRVLAIKAAMRGDGGGRIHTMAGIMASTISTPQYLRFCPQCNLEDEQKYGEYYWHRLHQMPGAIICPTHTTLIQDSTVKLDLQNRHEFIAANENNCTNNPPHMKYSDKDIYSLLLLARDIEWIVGNYELVRNYIKNHEGTRECYISGLQNKGYATSKGRVYQKDLVHDFIGFYGDDFLATVQCQINLESDDNWLSCIVRKHRKAFHILMHLLLIRFLFDSADAFIRNDEKYMPFGTGPWPCLNPAVDHYKSLVVNKVKVTHCYDTKHPVGTFECNCGFVYSRRGPDTSPNDKFKVGRIKSFGLVWEKKLIKLFENNMGLRETARIMKVDPKTIKLQAAKLGLNLKGVDFDGENNKKSSEHPKHSNLLEYHRNTWIATKAAYSDKSKTELRRIAKSHFIWLYRHDREWLDINSPEHQKLQCTNGRIDWVKRDSEVLQEVKKAVEVIRDSKEKPVKISLGRIGMICGLQGLLDKHLDKMPQTKRYIDKVVDNDDSFRKRRIIWAIHELTKSGEELKLWKVMRMAGIRKEYEKQAEECLADCKYK